MALANIDTLLTYLRRGCCVRDSWLALRAQRWRFLRTHWKCCFLRPFKWWLERLADDHDLIWPFETRDEWNRRRWDAVMKSLTHHLLGMRESIFRVGESMGSARNEFIKFNAVLGDTIKEAEKTLMDFKFEKRLLP